MSSHPPPYSFNREPILIAVLGETGAGKTTFINTAADTHLQVSSSIDSCQHLLQKPMKWGLTTNALTGTQDIAYANVIVDGRTVTLIDTPGFNDSQRTDTDILKLIAQWLQGTYEYGKLLTGVILLQPINGIRAVRSEKTRTALFQEICGENAFSHVVIATTMWSEVNNKLEAYRRVEERKIHPDFWFKMIAKGATVVNYENRTKYETHKIIRTLLYKGQVAMKMQPELQNNNGALFQTSAGRLLHENLSDEEKQRWKELQEALQDERSSRALLEITIKELREKINALDAQKTELRNERVSDFSFPSLCLGSAAS